MQITISTVLMETQINFCLCFTKVNTYFFSAVPTLSRKRIFFGTKRELLNFKLSLLLPKLVMVR